MPTPAAIRPYPPETRGFGPFPKDGSALRRRARYCIRFLRFLAIHRNIKSVRWVLACEGTTWN